MTVTVETEKMMPVKTNISCSPMIAATSLSATWRHVPAERAVGDTGGQTKAFAARNNRLRIIEGGELKHLLAEHLDLDVRIDLGRPPRRTA
jgi:hypothetical protein